MSVGLFSYSGEFSEFMLMLANLGEYFRDNPEAHESFNAGIQEYIFNKGGQNGKANDIKK